LVRLVLSLLFILFFSSLINYTRNRKQEWYICIFFIFLLTIISGFRYDVGMDFPNYELMYNEPDHPMNNFIEPSWIIISKILHFLNLKSVSWFMFTSFIINMNILNTLYRYSKSFIFSVCLYIVSTEFFFQSMNIVRQYFAISIIFGFIHLYIERKYLKFIFVIIGAALFHPSALFTIPFFLIGTINFSPYILTLILFISYGIKNYVLSFLEMVLKMTTNYAGYLLHMDAATSSSGLYSLMLLLIGLFLIWYFGRNEKLYKWLNLTIISFCIYIAFIQFEAGQRINLYFFPALLILISYIPEKKRMSETIVYTFSIIGGFFLFFIKAAGTVVYRVR